MTLWVFTRFRLHSKSLQSYLTLWDPRDCSPPGSSVHGVFQARILSGLPCPPPGNRLTQGSNLCLLHFRWILCCLSNLGSPVYEMKVKVKFTQLCTTLCDPMDYTVHGILQARIQEWVAFPFSRVSSQSRDQTQVSCIAGGFFTS